jgi:phage portal protein BeeE
LRSSTPKRVHRAPAKRPFAKRKPRASKAGLEQKSLANPEAWLLQLFGAATVEAGVSVTPKTAMACAPVRCAVQAISEAIGQLPIHVYRRGDDGSKERETKHPAFDLLHEAANEWTPSAAFKEAITRDALLCDIGGVAFINRVEGKPIELIRLDPERTSYRLDPGTSEPVSGLQGFS